MKPQVTLVLTSCGRYDLLARTLESFYRFNTYPLAEVIIAEDWNREGQSIITDRAYSRVKTPYIFHCEDDWEFYKEGFIEKSLEILESHPNILQVWLREHNDTNGHLIGRIPQFNFEVMSNAWASHEGHTWGGFSWNPGLRRLSDYKRLGKPFYDFSQGKIDTELRISEAYVKLGYFAAILPQGYVKHIGWTRSTH